MVDLAAQRTINPFVIYSRMTVEQYATAAMNGLLGQVDSDDRQEITSA